MHRFIGCLASIGTLAALAAQAAPAPEWTRAPAARITLDATGHLGGPPVAVTRQNLREPPRAAPAFPAPLPVVTIPNWKGRAVAAGRRWHYYMVGTDPTKAGAGITSITVVVIPVHLNFANGVLDPTLNAPCSGNQVPLTLFANSPLLVSGNLGGLTGGTNLGTSQYIDLFQRGNYWSFTGGGANPNYHVLLNPVLGPTLTLTDRSASIIAQACGGVGLVSYRYIDGLVRGVLLPKLPRYGFDANTLPLFVFYDVLFTLPGGGYFVGYHSADSHITAGRVWTYALGSYTDNMPNVVSDVEGLSHELGEWMDDPFGANGVPPWGHIGQQPACQNNLEVGDPLTGTHVVLQSKGNNYTLQELAYTSWFYRQNPSTGANGWYSLFNTLAGNQPICQ